MVVLSGDLYYSILIPVTILTVVIFYVFLKSFLPKPKVIDFNKKHVLITGCDTGFGKTTAIRLDQLGFHVIAACLTSAGKANLQEVCSDRLIGVLMDVTDSKQIQNVYEEVKQIIPTDQGLWAVINNAGYMILGPLEWFKLDEYKRMADVNLWGLIDVTRTFLPLVKKAKGRVVNVASVSGLISKINSCPYAITKYGVEAFSDALRREMVTWGVKVCIMEPQSFKTPLWDEITGKKLTSLWNGISDEMKKEYGEEFFTKLKKGLSDEFNALASEKTDLVVDAFIDAVTSCHPQLRYLIGGRAKFEGGFLARLPTALQDYMLKRK